MPGMCAEIRWDAPSRFGSPGRLARRCLERLLKPALVRQAAINSELRGQLAAAQQEIRSLREVSIDVGGVPGDLGALQYRVDALARRAELAQAVSLLSGVTVPAEGERITAVRHDWRPGETPRVLCTGATGAHASLLDVTAIGMEKYARRHRWDLVLSREELSQGRAASWGKLPLVRSLLKAYPIVAWIDCDAVFADFEHDLGDVLEDGKDFYIVEQRAGSRVTRW